MSVYEFEITCPRDDLPPGDVFTIDLLYWWQWEKPPVRSQLWNSCHVCLCVKIQSPLQKTHLAAPSYELTHHSLWLAPTSFPLTSQHLADAQSCYFQLFIPLFIPSEEILTASDTWKSGNHGVSGLHDGKSRDEILVLSSKRTANACILGCFPSLFSHFKLWYRLREVSTATPTKHVLWGFESIPHINIDDHPLCPPDSWTSPAYFFPLPELINSEVIGMCQKRLGSQGWTLSRLDRNFFIQTQKCLMRKLLMRPSGGGSGPPLLIN